jgi:hypothetical protein
MGVGWNRASEYKECPVLGFGTEHTYQVSDRMKLFADLAYQVTTGGFLDTKYETGDGPNTNGWLDFSIGIQYDLGKNKWKKTR